MPCLCPNPIVPSKSSSASVVQRLEAAVAKAKSSHDFRDLIQVMEEEGFAADPATSAADKQKIARLIDQALTFVKSVTPTKESIRCQALIARYYAENAETDKAVVNYREAIEVSQNSWRQALEQPPGPSLFEHSCQIALATPEAYSREKLQKPSNYTKRLTGHGKTFPQKKGSGCIGKICLLLPTGLAKPCWLAD